MRPYVCVMERGKCLMSMKLSRPSSDSALFWPFGEERVFSTVEEYGGGGGCMWPPRSYSCSFCGREFKSAQALGGHMNVHRRDRARLKQQSLSSSSDPATPNLEYDHQEAQEKQHKVLDVGSKVLESRKREISEVCNNSKDNNVLGYSMKKLFEDKNDEVKTDLSVGFSSLKKAKKDVSRLPMMLGLVIGVSKMNGHHHEELDLELRLGADPPKVN